MNEQQQWYDGVDGKIIQQQYPRVTGNHSINDYAVMMAGADFVNSLETTIIALRAQLEAAKAARDEWRGTAAIWQASATRANAKLTASVTRVNAKLTAAETARSQAEAKAALADAMASQLYVLGTNDSVLVFRPTDEDKFWREWRARYAALSPNPKLRRCGNES